MITEKQLDGALALKKIANIYPPMRTEDGQVPEKSNIILK